MTKKIYTGDIINTVKDLCIKANYELGEDVCTTFKNGMEDECESSTGKKVLEALLKNAEIARNEHIPMCQDTGFAVFFIELGQDVQIPDGFLVDAINEGVRQGYRDGFLRKSICDPFTRKNTNDNAPAVINVEIVKGNSMKIMFAPKGGGSTNMSRVTVLKPADGIEGIKDYVINRVKEAGSNPCPPIIVGVGVGGTLEKTAIIAKKALLRPLGTSNPDPELNFIEKDILDKINRLGMGPQGLGGKMYAMGVHIEKFPCHIASLPVAVNICCHASRHKEAVL